MPFINGKFYMNPAYGRAIERARGEGAPEHHGLSPEQPDAHWVTIDGRHVFIQETQRNRNRRTKQSTRTQDRAKAPPNSREDVVLIPAGNGKPLANQDMNGMWTMSWAPRDITQNKLGPTGTEYAGSDVALTESVNGGPFVSRGSQTGGFRDLVSPESRTITQRFTIDGKRVQVVLGRDAEGNLIKTWEVHVVLKYPDAPAYSAAP